MLGGVFRIASPVPRGVSQKATRFSEGKLKLRFPRPWLPPFGEGRIAPSFDNGGTMKRPEAGLQCDQGALSAQSFKVALALPCSATIQPPVHSPKHSRQESQSAMPGMNATRRLMPRPWK